MPEHEIRRARAPPTSHSASPLCSAPAIRFRPIWTTGGSGCLSGRNIAGNSPRSGAKAIDLCNTGDPACGAGANVLAHLTHGFDGSATKAADFAAQKLR
ncbi:cutinase family protein [Amycolatopsis sp.]|uniref:cutinase family protein n=1 Tax=Amycolatopsis sp. TaxID=37632 RepID=UPI0039C87906